MPWISSVHEGGTGNSGRTTGDGIILSEWIVEVNLNLLTNCLNSNFCCWFERQSSTCCKVFKRVGSGRESQGQLSSTLRKPIRDEIKYNNYKSYHTPGIRLLLSFFVMWRMLDKPSETTPMKINSSMIINQHTGGIDIKAQDIILRHVDWFRRSRYCSQFAIDKGAIGREGWCALLTHWKAGK